MGLRVVLCDDDTEDRQLEGELICKVLDSVLEGYEIIEYSGGTLLTKDKAKVLACDLIVLDIDMPDMDGIQAALILMQEVSDINIVFVTNRTDLVFDAIHCRPLRFVRKENMSTELPEAVQAALTKIKDESFLYDFGTGRVNLRVQIRDIVYLESYGHYVNIHTEKGILQIRAKISDYQDRLQSYGFIRVHIGYLVNVRCIYSITSKGITLDDGKELPISRKNVNKIKERYANYVRRFVHGIY